jgi:phage terminase large subunit-like protein
MRSKGKRSKSSSSAVLEPPRPWWGAGEDPSVRWPGATVALSVVLRNDRWESTDGRYWFDQEAADFVEQFFPTCLQHHIGSEWNGRPFELMDYQRVIVRAVFGWKRTSDGLRRFRKVFLAVPKGNGKSPFGAGLGLFLAFFDGEAGAEVYCVAADRQQARIVFDSARMFVKRNPALESRFEVFRDHIDAIGGNETLHVISSDASTKHGFRPHGIIFDEFHAQPDRELHDTLYRGMGKRLQPMLVMITTAGNDDESICFEEWDYARKVISGTVEDPVYFPMIFESPADEDWTDEATWRRVNPGYGITMKADYFHTEATVAQIENRKRNSFLQLHLNRWTNQATAWIPIEWWDACASALPSDDVLKAVPCALGIDMAQKIDLAAVVAVFRLPLEQPVEESVEVVSLDDQGAVQKRRLSLNYRIAVLPKFWLPEDTLRDRIKQDRVPYDEWAREGLLDVTEGAVIDADAILRWIDQLMDRFPLLKQGEIGFDPAFASEISRRLIDHGRKAVEVLQNYKHLSEACQATEALIKAKRVVHGGHRLLRWNVENVAVKTDDAGRIRPVKPKKAAKRIDGIVALIMAESRLMVMPEPKRKAIGVYSL